jgi:hypothetical protein
VADGHGTQFSMFINSDQADLLNRVSYLAARTGTAADLNSIQHMTRKAIQASGQFDLNIAADDSRKVAKATRKMNSVGCKGFMRERVVKGGRLHEFTKSGMRRKSKMCEKRARAVDPKLELIARRKYVDGVEKLIRKRKITAAQFLDPSRHHGMDEVAQSTNNRHGRVMSYGIDADYFDQTINCPHEKPLFHTSICLTSCPDGTMSQEMLVIHAQKSEMNVTMDVYKGLSRNILVDSSASAYNTQAIFLKLMKDFQKKTKACEGNPQFYWVDNHESHWSGKAIKYVSLSWPYDTLSLISNLLSVSLYLSIYLSFHIFLLMLLNIS